MINTIRTTVLSVLNKNNYGYLSPSDFNLFAKQAQLDIFEDYFYRYNNQINKENGRSSGVDYADIKKGLEHAIDAFSETGGLVREIENSFFLPSQATTGDDYYLMNKVLVYRSVLTSGETTSVGSTNTLIDSSATFQALGVAVGDTIGIEDGVVRYEKVVSVTSETELVSTGTYWDATGMKYSIIKKGTKQEELEKVSNSRITMLQNSSITKPSLSFPVYAQEGNALTALPSTIEEVARVTSQYIRYPKDPNWTYMSLSGGEPVFNQSNSDFQDFELSIRDSNNLIIKILQYAGITIREASINQYAKGEEIQDKQEQG